MNDQSLPIGVCALPDRIPNRARTVQYASYVHEVLSHAGLAYRPVQASALAEALPGLRLLVTVYDQSFDEALQQALRQWVSAGGAWLAIGGTCGLPDLLGVEPVPPAHASWGGGVSTMGPGYLAPRAPEHPVFGGLPAPLHFFGGVMVRSAGARVLAGALDLHGRPGGPDVAFEHRIGRGRCILLAPDITGTIVHVQNGISVTRDGVAAPDGSAPLTDGVLKSGDGHVLDWVFDRDPIEGAPGLSAFLRPVADQWRQVLLRSIFHLASEQQVALPLLWLWPRGLPAVAHMSHDTDGNDPAAAAILLETLAAADIRSTWCVILPGYDAALVARIRESGHELAMHFDAMTPGLEWSEQQFERQHRELTALFDGESITTNKNHYLRWENDTDLFDWCARRGIQMDQSKGASKTGEAGFNFGTCHPWFPVTFGGRTVDVLELPTPTQDLTVFAPEAILDPLLRAARSHHGVLHLLFHPAHLKKPQVPPAVLRAVQAAKAAGLEWWTARQINAWQRARRQGRWGEYDGDGNAASVAIHAGAELREATLLWLDPDGEFAAWGYRFRAEQRTLPGGETHRMRWR